MTSTERKNRRYLIRYMIRQNEAHLGGRDIDLIDTFDYRDIFTPIKPDSFDTPPETYLPRRFR